MNAGTSDVLGEYDEPREGVYRGPVRRIRRRRVSGRRAELLSLLWPGLGHAYLDRQVAAALFAVPPAVILIVTIGWVAIDPPAFALGLLGGTFGLAILALIAGHGLWRVVAIFDVARIARHKASDPQHLFALAGALGAVVLAAHLVAGSYVQSFVTAGERIFTPAGSASNDLGGLISGDPGQIPGGPILGTADLNGDGHPDGDMNCDGVVNSADDMNGDGIINADDFDYADANGDGIPCDETTTVEGGSDDGDGQGLPVGVPFDPSATPPPFDPAANPPPGVLPADGPINVLFVGVDSGIDRDHALTDSLIVASYYPSADTLTMISVPRDTSRFPIYNGGTYPNRINTFLSYAARHPELFPQGSIAALMNELGYLLGVPINFYAATNLDGLPVAVDSVGGIDIVVDKAVDSVHEDYHIQPGTYHFDGLEALQYSRVRYGSSDFSRAKRQQHVLEALAARAEDPSVLIRLPEIVTAIASVVRTDVPSADASVLLDIVKQARAASTSNIVLSPIAGYSVRIPAAEVNGRYMIEPNIAAIGELSERIFGTYSRYQ